MRDADKLRELVDSGQVKNAVIVGGGLIGIEVCEALSESGMQVDVVEMLSPSFCCSWTGKSPSWWKKHVASKGVTVHTDNGVSEFLGENGKLTGVKLKDGNRNSLRIGRGGHRRGPQFQARPTGWPGDRQIRRHHRGRTHAHL